MVTMVVGFAEQFFLFGVQEKVRTCSQEACPKAVQTSKYSKGSTRSGNSEMFSLLTVYPLTPGYCIQLGFPTLSSGYLALCTVSNRLEILVVRELQRSPNPAFESRALVDWPGHACYS
jgi:hypothetical protein